MLNQINFENITRPIVRKRWVDVCKIANLDPFVPPFEWKMLRNTWTARYMWSLIIKNTVDYSELNICNHLDVPSHSIIFVDKSKKHDMLIYVDRTFFIVNTRYLVDPMCLSLTDPKELICMLVRDFIQRPKEVRWM